MVVIISSSVKVERILEYQVGLMLVLGLYSDCHWELNMSRLM